MIILHPIIGIIIILNLSRLRGRLYAHDRLAISGNVIGWKFVEITGNAWK